MANPQIEELATEERQNGGPKENTSWTIWIQGMLVIKDMLNVRSLD